MGGDLAMAGVSHRTAPLEVRERYHVASRAAETLLRSVVASGPAEALVVSTCNRTELYLATPPGERDDPGSGDLAARATAALARSAGYPTGEAASHLRVGRGCVAARHLLEVTAGMASMVPGEPQIQGQVRDAYRRATRLEPRVVGPVLTRLFDTALSVGGEVRSDTGLGTGAVSLPGAALLLARRVMGPLYGRRAMVIGAGEISEGAVAALRKAGVEEVFLANRTVERAAEVAARAGGVAIPFSECRARLADVDVVLTATAAPHPILTADAVGRAREGTTRRRLLVMDLAVPRDVEAGVGDLPGVLLHTIDDLREVIDQSLARRAATMPAAERVVSRGVARFVEWHRSRRAAPVIRTLRKEMEAVRRKEVERAIGKLDHLAPEDREAVEDLSRRLVNKLLHKPTVQLRHAAVDGREADTLEMARYLFGLQRREGGVDGVAGAVDGYAGGVEVGAGARPPTPPGPAERRGRTGPGGSPAEPR